MNIPTYLDLNGARSALSEIGIEFSRRQMKRAAETDAQGMRKLPFFIDPIDKKLKIEKGMLLEIYNQRQIEAKKNSCATIFNEATEFKGDNGDSYG